MKKLVDIESLVRYKSSPGGGDVLGGVVICAAESRRPPKRCRMVDSSN